MFEVEDLQREYNKVGKQLQASLDRQEEKRDMINKITAIDKENQELRRRIATLQEQITDSEE